MDIVYRRTSNTPEKHTMKIVFYKYLEENRLPTLHDCRNALMQWVKNQNTKKQNVNRGKFYMVFEFYFK